MYSRKYRTVTDRNGQNVFRHVQEFFDVFAKWFNRLQDGTHVLAIPDPFDNTVEPEKADRVVNEIDQDFEDHENWRIIQGKYDALPQFSRLSSNARIAMVQEIFAVLRYQKEHPEEYTEPI